MDKNENLIANVLQYKKKKTVFFFFHITRSKTPAWLVKGAAI
jgi:hypothetical protein